MDASMDGEMGDVGSSSAGLYCAELCSEEKMAWRFSDVADGRCGAVAGARDRDGEGCIVIWWV